MDLTDLVRGQLTAQDRATLGALITVDVHARDVVVDLVAAGLKSVHDFEWVKQLRYYWRGDIKVDMVQVRYLAPGQAVISFKSPNNAYLGCIDHVCGLMYNTSEDCAGRPH